MVLRADSAYYGAEVIAAARRHHSPLLGHRPQGPGRHRGDRLDQRGSLDARSTTRTRSSTSSCSSGSATPRSPRSPFTAFTSTRQSRAGHRPADRAPSPRRQPRPRSAHAQAELFRVCRHHAVFTDSPLPMLQAEADHRRHAIIEQVIADLKNGPLAHLPSGKFAANSAWLVLRRDRVQPDPRRRRPRLDRPRQGHHRDHPRRN